MDWSLIYVMLTVGIIEVLRRMLFSDTAKAESSGTSGTWLLSGFSGGALAIMAAAGMVGAMKVVYGVAVVTVIGAFVLGYLSVANRWASPLRSAFIFVTIWLILAVFSLITMFAGEPIMGAYIWWGATALLFLVCLAGGYAANQKFNSR